MSEDKQPHTASTMIKDYAGILVCSLTVIAFISVGFVLMGAKIVFGLEVTPPGEWIAAMLSLASTALGFLAGQKSQNSNNQQNNSQD
jgi:hypothetical protein